MCCSMLQCVAVCCSVLQCVAVFRSVLQYFAVLLLCVAMCCVKNIENKKLTRSIDNNVDF